MAYIELRNITKSYGDRMILKDISFDINEGETISIVGPSGTGKSTLLRIICGILEEDGGSITVGGRKSLEFAAGKAKHPYDVSKL